MPLSSRRTAPPSRRNPPAPPDPFAAGSSRNPAPIDYQQPFDWDAYDRELQSLLGDSQELQADIDRTAADASGPTRLKAQVQRELDVQDAQIRQRGEDLGHAAGMRAPTTMLRVGLPMAAGVMSGGALLPVALATIGATGLAQGAEALADEGVAPTITPRQQMGDFVGSLLGNAVNVPAAGAFVRPGSGIVRRAAAGAATGFVEGGLGNVADEVGRTVVAGDELTWDKVQEQLALGAGMGTILGAGFGAMSPEIQRPEAELRDLWKQAKVTDLRGTAKTGQMIPAPPNVARPESTLAGRRQPFVPPQQPDQLDEMILDVESWPIEPQGLLGPADIPQLPPGPPGPPQLPPPTSIQPPPPDDWTPPAPRHFGPGRIQPSSHDVLSPRWLDKVEGTPRPPAPEWDANAELNRMVLEDMTANEHDVYETGRTVTNPVTSGGIVPLLKPIQFGGVPIGAVDLTDPSRPVLRPVGKGDPIPVPPAVAEALGVKVPKPEAPREVSTFDIERIPRGADTYRDAGTGRRVPLPEDVPNPMAGMEPAPVEPYEFRPGQREELEARYNPEGVQERHDLNRLRTDLVDDYEPYFAGDINELVRDRPQLPPHEPPAPPSRYRVTDKDGNVIREGNADENAQRIADNWTEADEAEYQEMLRNAPFDENGNPKVQPPPADPVDALMATETFQKAAPQPKPKKEKFTTAATEPAVTIGNATLHRVKTGDGRDAVEVTIPRGVDKEAKAELQEAGFVIRGGKYVYNVPAKPRDDVRFNTYDEARAFAEDVFTRADAARQPAASAPSGGETIDDLGDEEIRKLLATADELDAAAAARATEPDVEVVDPETDLVRNNASGESSASWEAMKRLKDMRERGEQFVHVDRAGNITPLITTDAVDVPPPPGKTKGIVRRDGTFQLLDGQGRPPKPAEVQRIARTLAPAADPERMPQGGGITPEAHGRGTSTSPESVADNAPNVPPAVNSAETSGPLKIHEESPYADDDPDDLYAATLQDFVNLQRARNEVLDEAQNMRPGKKRQALEENVRELDAEAEEMRNELRQAMGDDAVLRLEEDGAKQLQEQRYRSDFTGDEDDLDIDPVDEMMGDDEVMAAAAPIAQRNIDETGTALPQGPKPAPTKEPSKFAKAAKGDYTGMIADDPTFVFKPKMRMQHRTLGEVTIDRWMNDGKPNNLQVTVGKKKHRVDEADLWPVDPDAAFGAFNAPVAPAPDWYKPKAADPVDAEMNAPDADGFKRDYAGQRYTDTEGHEVQGWKVGEAVTNRKGEKGTIRKLYELQPSRYRKDKKEAWWRAEVLWEGKKGQRSEMADQYGRTVQGLDLEGQGLMKAKGPDDTPPAPKGGKEAVREQTFDPDDYGVIARTAQEEANRTGRMTHIRRKGTKLVVEDAESYEGAGGDVNEAFLPGNKVRTVKETDAGDDGALSKGLEYVNRATPEDHKILSTLLDDPASGIDVAQLVKRTGLTRDALMARLRKMADAELVESINTRPHVSRAGMITADRLNLNPHTPGENVARGRGEYSTRESQKGKPDRGYVVDGAEELGPFGSRSDADRAGQLLRDGASVEDVQAQLRGTSEKPNYPGGFVTFKDGDNPWGPLEKGDAVKLPGDDGRYMVEEVGHRQLTLRGEDGTTRKVPLTDARLDERFMDDDDYHAKWLSDFGQEPYKPHPEGSFEASFIKTGHKKVGGGDKTDPADEMKWKGELDGVPLQLTTRPRTIAEGENFLTNSGMRLRDNKVGAGGYFLDVVVEGDLTPELRTKLQGMIEASDTRPVRIRMKGEPLGRTGMLGGKIDLPAQQTPRDGQSNDYGQGPTPKQVQDRKLAAGRRNNGDGPRVLSVGRSLKWRELPVGETVVMPSATKGEYRVYRREANEMLPLTASMTKEQAIASLLEAYPESTAVKVADAPDTPDTPETPDTPVVKLVQGKDGWSIDITAPGNVDPGPDGLPRWKAESLQKQLEELKLSGVWPGEKVKVGNRTAEVMALNLRGRDKNGPAVYDAVLDFGRNDRRTGEVIRADELARAKPQADKALKAKLAEADKKTAADDVQRAKDKPTEPASRPEGEGQERYDAEAGRFTATAQKKLVPYYHNVRDEGWIASPALVTEGGFGIMSSGHNKQYHLIHPGTGLSFGTAKTVADAEALARVMNRVDPAMAKETSTKAAAAAYYKELNEAVEKGWLQRDVQTRLVTRGPKYSEMPGAPKGRRAPQANVEDAASVQAAAAAAKADPEGFAQDAVAQVMKADRFKDTPKGREERAAYEKAVESIRSATNETERIQRVSEVYDQHRATGRKNWREWERHFEEDGVSTQMVPRDETPEQRRARVEQTVNGFMGRDKGTTLGSGFGSLQALGDLFKKDPAAAWFAVRTGGGALLGGLYGEMTEDPDDTFEAIMAGAALGAGSRPVLRALKKYGPAAGEALDAAFKKELFRSQDGRTTVSERDWKAPFRPATGKPVVRRAADPTRDIGGFNASLGMPDRAVPDVFKTVRPILDTMDDQLSQIAEHSPPEFVEMVRKTYTNEAISAMEKAAQQARQNNHPLRADYIEKLMASVRNEPDAVIRTLQRTGMSRGTAQKIVGTAQQAFYNNTLGLAIDSMVGNLSQSLMTAVMIGPGDALKGVRAALTKEGKDSTKWLALEKPMGLEDAKSFHEAMDHISNFLQIPMRATDTFNRRAAYLGAKEHAMRRGASQVEAHDFALELTGATQGVPGDLGENPFWRQMGPMKALTKYPRLWSAFAVDALTHPDPAVRMRFVGLMVGAGVASQLFGMQLMNFIVPRVQGIPFGEAAWDVGEHVFGASDLDHEMQDHATIGGPHSALLPRYLEKVVAWGRRMRDFGTEDRPIRGRAGQLVKDTSAANDTMSLFGLETKADADDRQQRSDAYTFTERARQEQTIQSRRAKRGASEALDRGDYAEADRFLNELSGNQRRTFLRERNQSPIDRLRRQVPRDRRAEFDERFR